MNLSLDWQDLFGRLWIAIPFVAIVGWMFKRFVLEPVDRYNKVKDEIIQTLNLHVSVIANAGYLKGNPQADEARTALEREQSELIAITNMPKLQYSILERVRFFPKKRDMLQAAAKLESLSTFICTGTPMDAYDSVKTIRTLLKIEHLTGRGKF